jgi:glutamyl-tRNA reductase
MVKKWQALRDRFERYTNFSSLEIDQIEEEVVNLLSDREDWPEELYDVVDDFAQNSIDKAREEYREDIRYDVREAISILREVTGDY